ncbi:MAG TPA: ATP-binding protein [Verrucomicrobiae bacterium]|nr:ATP-binding protein [Verrucomicrobiae bacterium]
MTDMLPLNFLEESVLYFPPEWIKSALVLALITVWMVIVLFTYMNFSGRRSHLSLWTVAWMFYSVYLAASIGLEESPQSPLLLMASRASIGISALFMFWGSFHLSEIKRDQRELALATAMIIIWSYVAAYRVQDGLWLTLPVFVLLATAGVYTGILYIRARRRSRGSMILGLGFLLWGIHLIGFPLASGSQVLMATAYLTSAILALLIVVGMVIEDNAKLSERDYHALFDSSGEAIFLLDPQTFRVSEANQAALRLSGRTADELIGRQFIELCPGLLPALARVNDPSAASALHEASREFQFLRPDGTEFPCEGNASLVHCPKGPVLLLSVRDITARQQTEQSLRASTRQLASTVSELKETQQQIVQQERLRALAQMASGVAHDFNNVLAKILGFNELLLAWPENLNDTDKVKKYVQMTSAAAQEAVNIVNRLREFYRHRKESDVYQAVDINDTITQAIVMTQPKWKDQMMASGATVVMDANLKDVPPVRGSDSDLRESLINLLLNAVDAMPQGGTLTVATRAEEPSVAIEVRDTGRGMTEEVRQRCFEPFFTTKGERGTGLGLAIVYGIIQRHGGSIDVQSEPGKGTTFVIRLPVFRAENGDAPAGGDMSATRSAPGRPLRILVVEDEPQVREIEAEYLRGDGHFVETAADGREAVQRFKQWGYDVVVADRAMPEMNGDQLTAAIKQMSPKTPVVMVTGFADMPTDGVDPAQQPNLILRKPITQLTLRQAVARVVAPPAPPGKPRPTVVKFR